LIFNVHIVVLNLAERPLVRRINDLLQSRELVVKRETEMPDAPVGDSLLGPLAHAQIAHLGPAILIQSMQEVKINVLGL